MTLKLMRQMKNTVDAERLRVHGRGEVLQQPLMLALGTVFAIVAAHGEVATLEWTLRDGSTRTESRTLEAAGADALSLTLTREELLGAKAKKLLVTPEFAKASKGESGYWFSPYGYYGEWDRDNGDFRANAERMNMPMYGWSTPRGSHLAIITSLAYYPRLVVRARKGEYRVSCELGNELLSRPYENFRIEFHRRAAGASYGELAAIYRDYQLGRGAVKPLNERVKENPILRAAVESPEIRIRQAWKPVPSPVFHQSPENEPEVKAVITFDRVRDIVRELKAQGVGDAELCLVGWNIGGHDGRWPQYFPAEPKLGGTEKLREAIAYARENGYLIVPHGNFRDTYTVADSWDAEFLAKEADGLVRNDRNGKFTWGGGLPYVICPKRAYEKYVLRDFPRLSGLGFRGMGYFDVVSILEASECQDPRHPLSFKEGAEYWGRCAEVSKREFGGFASEGAVDHFAGSLDSVLYASFDSNEKIAARYAKGGLARRHVPIFQLVYNGIIVQNPFTHTVNLTVQKRDALLKFVEYGGRPNFYFYSKFKSDGKGWMGDGDLGCATDEQLKWSVSKIREGWNLYRRLRHLQYAFMKDHEKLAEGVFRTTWSNGESVIVNYTGKPFVVDGTTVGGGDWALVPLRAQ